jgi:WXG100 family type VII secretion target
MAIINVSPSDLRALSDAYRQEADEMRVRAVRLSRKTDPLLHDWAGSASSSFRTLAQNVETGQRDLIDTLEKMAGILANAADAFESIDSNISSALE